MDEATHTDPTTGETVRHYLVKWRSLQYEDSTWELEEDVDSEKIAQFVRFNKVPPKEQWKVYIFLIYIKKFYIKYILHTFDIFKIARFAYLFCKIM